MTTKQTIKAFEQALQAKIVTLESLAVEKQNPTVAPVYHRIKGQIDALSTVISVLRGNMGPLSYL